MAQFTDNIKFRWRNLNVINLILINLHISLITKRLFRYFDRYSDKTVTLSSINNFSYKIMDVIRKSHEFSFEIARVITIVVSNPHNFLVNARLWRQSIASGCSMTSRIAAIFLWVLLHIFYTPWEKVSAITMGSYSSSVANFKTWAKLINVWFSLFFHYYYIA